MNHQQKSHPGVESQSVANEITGVVIQTVLLVHFLYCCFGWIHVLPGCRVLLIKLLDEYEEVLEPPLLEHAHQVGR